MTFTAYLKPKAIIDKGVIRNDLILKHTLARNFVINDLTNCCYLCGVHPGSSQVFKPHSWPLILSYNLHMSLSSILKAYVRITNGRAPKKNRSLGSRFTLTAPTIPKRDGGRTSRLNSYFLNVAKKFL